MSINWLFVATFVVVVWVIGGVFGILLLTKSLGSNIFKIREEGISASEVTSVLRKIVFSYLILFSLSLLPWSAIVGSIGGMLDQYFRNTVNEWMSPPDLFDHISITQDEYASLPDYWRRTLADFALRPAENAADIKRLIYSLSLEDIRLIDLLAPYWTQIGIIRDDSKRSDHPMPELSFGQLSHLQTLGILEDVNDGMEANVSNFRLVGKTVSARVKVNDENDTVKIKYTALTRSGKQLISSLQIHSNVSYFEWFAKSIEKQGAEVELHVTGVSNSKEKRNYLLQGQIVRDSVPIWPPKQ